LNKKALFAKLLRLIEKQEAHIYLPQR